MADDKVTAILEATQILHEALADRYGEGLFEDQLRVIFGADATERFVMLDDIAQRMGGDADPREAMIREAARALLAVLEDRTPGDGEIRVEAVIASADFCAIRAAAADFAIDVEVLEPARPDGRRKPLLRVVGPRGVVTRFLTDNDLTVETREVRS